MLTSFFATLKKELLYRVPTYKMRVSPWQHNCQKDFVSLYDCTFLDNSRPIKK